MVAISAQCISEPAQGQSTKPRQRPSPPSKLERVRLLPNPLPCHSHTHLTATTPPAPQPKPTPRSLKQSFQLHRTLEYWQSKYGIERLGVLTLTFAPPHPDHDEAKRRFKSFRTGVLNKRYVHWVAIWEPHKSGTWHLHLVVVLKNNIRHAFNFDAYLNARKSKTRQDRHYWTRIYSKSAGSELRLEWNFLRGVCSKYGFGRHELLPVGSTVADVANYLSKCLLKPPMSQGTRIRRLAYSAGSRNCSTAFSWVGGNSRLWRRKLSAFAGALTELGFPVEDQNDLKALFGSRWCYHLRAVVLAIGLDGSAGFTPREAAEMALQAFGHLNNSSMDPPTLHPRAPRPGGVHQEAKIPPP